MSYLRAILSMPQADIARELEREDCRRSLGTFLRRAWPNFDPAPYQHGWHIDAICLPDDAEITTEIGPMKIADLVRAQWQGRVLSFNHNAGYAEWKPVRAWMDNAGSPLVAITLSTGQVVECTDNHPVFVVGSGYVRADEVRPGDAVISLRDLQQATAYPEASDEVLQPRLLHGVEAAHAGSIDNTVRALRQGVFQMPVAAARRLLQHAMLWVEQGGARKVDVPYLRRSETVGREGMSGLLGQVETSASAEHIMQELWRGVAQNGRSMGVRTSEAWRFLQREVLSRIQPWAAQQRLHRWGKPCVLPQRVHSPEETHSGARWASVLRLLGGWQDGRSPYRPGQAQQCRPQPSDALPPVSFGTEGYAQGGVGEGGAVVLSVGRSSWLPDRVFNIEVDGNNNYFANGVLVHNCEHLEAVTAGDIKKLLINIPPRHMKTSIVSVAWQVWTWTLDHIDDPDAFNLLRGPGVTFLCGAYNSTKAQSDAVKARGLIRSTWFESMWGDTVKISPYVDNREEFQTTAGGHRISVGIPESLGKGGVIRLLDDPHKTDEVDTDIGRDRVVTNYKETWSTRENHPDGAEVMVMQRQKQNDLSGFVLDQGGWEHLCIPLEYDPARHCVTVLGWEDPRGLDDVTGERLGDLDAKGNVVPGTPLAERVAEPIWPERMGSEWCRKQENLVGSYAYAGQYQQAPAPRGGGIIKSEAWRLWDKVKFPDMELTLVSLDGAFTDKTMNDPSAVTVWGVFRLPDVREPQFMLMWAWQKRLQISDLVENVGRTCNGDWRGRTDLPPKDGGVKVDFLLIEAKASGHSVAQEVVRIYGRRNWKTLLYTPKGDKAARLMSCEPMFERGQVWAPDKDWAQEVIDQVANFPRASHDDLTDTVSQGLHWLRTMGVAQTKEEAEDEYITQNTYRRPRRALYPCA